MLYTQLKNGFTLIEIAVFFGIISIIIVAILVGNDVVQQSNILSQASQLQKFDKAVYTFQEKYKFLPGDFNKSSLYWGDSTSCTSGVGVKGGVGGSICTGGTDGDGNGLVDNGEAVVFWTQLTLSGIIPEYYTGQNGLLGYTNGVTMPQSKYDKNGCLIVTTAPGSTTINKYYNYYVLGMPYRMPIVNVLTSCSNGMLTPQAAYILDKKIDDGLAKTGDVLTVQGSDFAVNTCVDASNVYVLTSTQKACAIYAGVKGVK